MSDSLQPHGLLKLVSTESVMLSNHIILCHPLFLLPSFFPASGYFPMSQLFAWAGPSIGVLASASVLRVSIQDWFPLGLTGLISLLSNGLSRVFSSNTIQKHQIFSAQPSLWSNFHIHIQLYTKQLYTTTVYENQSFDCMELCQQSDVSAF